MKSLSSLLVFGLLLVIGSSSHAQQPAPDASTNAADPAAPTTPTYPPAADLTDAQLAKELTDLGAHIKTEGDAPDGAITEINFNYQHRAFLSPTGAMVPPYQVTDDLVARISKLPKLTHLELSMSPLLTNAGFIHLKGMTQLEYLALPNGRTDDTTMSYLAGLTNLTGFRSGGAVHVTTAGWAVIANWKKLTKFWVPEGPFGDNDAPFLKDLTQLSDIRLSGARVTDVGAEVLLGLPNLASLGKSDGISKAEIDKLKAAHPKCQFYK